MMMNVLASYSGSRRSGMSCLFNATCVSECSKLCRDSASILLCGTVFKGSLDLWYNVVSVLLRQCFFVLNWLHSSV